jgi:aspartyl-tRNA(Asn)/glutamyl-tRNA(Gln) amidotransferase subunit C
MLSSDEVKNIALLARIGLSDAEVERYRADFSAVLDFFSELETLPTDDVEPIGHITGRENVFRSDQAVEFGSAGTAGILGNAPAIKEGMWKVRSVF